jgi:classical protein kinase C
MGTSARKNYTNLDLIKYETPHTTAKISRMLHQLEFKLQIEQQYKMGIDKMAKLYQADGDRKSKNDAESKRVESSGKIRLLQQSLKRYKQLHVMEEEDDEDSNMPTSLEGRRQNLRKPLSGTLQVSVRSARDIDHIPNPKRGVRESTVVIKVEDTPRARTHPSRTDRWQEDFEVAVDNANEIEVTVYDRVGNAHPEPVGMLWIRISDIVEELRKKKFGQVADGNSPAVGGGWVTAQDVQEQQQPGMYGNTPQMLDATYNNGPAGVPVPMGPTSDGVEAWFTVEPAGAILLRVNFVKQNVRKRPYDARLGRQGAVRKRKEDVAEINGHKFISRQFYQIIRCALCGELLLNAAGSQCDDCRYTCHKKCAQKVVTKCISKSNAEADRDEVKINHRIPHRFVPITNIGANWCCHCGYILPLGRKSARKCSECDLTCHADCAHLVPDLCGMSMEMANQLLTDMEAINRVKSSARNQAANAVQGKEQRSDLSRPGGLTGLEQQTAQMGLRPQQQMPSYGTPSQPPQLSMPGMGQQAIPPFTRQGTVDTTQTGYGEAGQGSRPPRPLPQPAPALGQLDTQRMQGAPPSAMQQPGFMPGTGTGSQQQVPPGWQGGAPSKASAAPQGAITPSQSAPYLQGAAPLLSSPSGQIASKQQQQPPLRNPPSSKRKIGLEDFNFLAVLGKGNFGKVMLAEEKRTGYLYAIKVLKKEFIIENDEVESTKSEKRVFLAAARERHPFLLGLHSCFQTETRVYFVMEYVSGGDLMLHIQREQFTPRRAKFYAAEVLLALEYFHKQGIIYRDLKLDNILLTLDGHVKVADYGLCKEDMWYNSTTSTFCGTPEFMAPEILLEQRYGRAVDWWAFGILIYEMLLGQAPFRGDDEDEIFDAILEDEPLYPIHMPPDSVSILHKLLTRDPAKRLGAGPTDADEIKAHPFFRDINWDDMFHKRVPPPFIPTLKNPSDTSWFDTEFTSEKPTLTPVHSVLSTQDQAEFKAFSWTAPHIS